ncbi:MAG: hypothetical protein PF545_06315 [Elusimicrobia bacterium]|jgi:hypothetical protein|nr:hypothetical protein [Elusimicrobiota bacterium]
MVMTKNRKDEWWRCEYFFFPYNLDMKKNVEKKSCLLGGEKLPARVKEQKNKEEGKND